MQYPRPVLRHRFAEYGDPAAIRFGEAHDHADGRGLAGAIAAKQPHDRATRDAEADRIDGRLTPVPFDERFD
jgi:hypothetical protein